MSDNANPLSSLSHLGLGLFTSGLLVFSGGLFVARHPIDVTAASPQSIAGLPAESPLASARPPQSAIEFALPPDAFAETIVASVQTPPAEAAAAPPAAAAEVLADVPPPAAPAPQPSPAAVAAPTKVPTRVPTTAPAPPPAPTAVPVAPAPAPAAPPPAAAPAGLTGMEQDMFAQHNGQRASAGMAGFRWDATLANVARQRAQDMAAKGYFAHTSPTGQTAFTLLAAAGYRYTIAGENIARNNYPDSQAVSAAMGGFMNSPTHRENILDSRFNSIGVGVVLGGDGMKYYAVEFAGR